MEMRAIEDINIGQDLTPPLPPLASVLRDSAISSHCSACFSTLPPHPFHPSTTSFSQNPSHSPITNPTPLYCSPRCSSFDSPLHFSSAESHLLSLFRQSPPSTWDDSSDLRLSLRLVSRFQNYSVFSEFPASSDQRLFLGGKKNYPFQETENGKDPDDHLENKDDPLENMGSCWENGFERIAGLMTNREKLILQNTDDGDNPDENSTNFEDSDGNTENVIEKIREGAKLMAMARRNRVEQSINVEKDDDFLLEEKVLCMVLTNAVEVLDKSGFSIGIAVYGNSFSWINHSCSPNASYRFLVGDEHIEQSSLRITSAAKCGYVDDLMIREITGYGPRVVVRSIKAVNKGEEVTIAYTDLLQPKEMRGAELWLKYRFLCSCKRCSAMPLTYVDYALQAFSPNIPHSSDIKIDELMQSFNDAITNYLSHNDPVSCCKNLENLLAPNEAKSPQNPKLHPFHYLSMNAYTALASAYKVHASDLMALNLESERQKLEKAFKMHKTSAAYSLLLAVVAHHLFLFESALVASAATFLVNAGESLLDISRSFLWGPLGPICLDFSFFLSYKCSDCCIGDVVELDSMELEEIKRGVYSCIARIALKVWSALISESSFLSSIVFGWLSSSGTSMILKEQECNEEVRTNLILLSLHCLRYGAVLSSVCNGLSVEMNYRRSLAILKEDD